MEKKDSYKAGDICFYDRETDKLIIVPFNDWSVQQYPYSRFVPIAVVVIPSSHDVYGNGRCGVMSLREMNYNTPDEGSASRQAICWGQYKVDTPLPKFDSCIAVGRTSSPTTYAVDISYTPYLPSDNFSETQCPTDPFAHYYHSILFEKSAPSPYLEDGSRNPVYYQIETPSSTLNCLSDFEGVGNTKELCDLATTQPNWKTDEKITPSYNGGHSPAACCCWRYHTEGTKQGDWYLPACGELGYMMVRLKTINDTINNLINAYGNAVGVPVAIFLNYWSSSEFSNYSARYIYMRNGCIYNYPKYLTNYVRSFLRV